MKQLLVGILLWGVMACVPDQTANTEEIIERKDSLKTTLIYQVPNNDLERKNLKGKLKSREVLVYKATIKDGYVTNDVLKGGIEVNYNEQGNQTKLVTYNEEKKVLNTWTYTYNSTEDLVESKYTDGGVNRTLKYLYNDAKKLNICEEYVNNKLIKKTTYVYNKKGKKVMTRDIFMESDGESKHVYEYDETGYNRETKTYDETGSLQLKQLYTYNELGQEIQQSIFTGDNIPSYKRKFEYDEKGNKIKNLAFNGDGVINAADSYKFKYEYDNQGNWTTKIRYDYDDVADEFMEQKIIYY